MLYKCAKTGTSPMPLMPLNFILENGEARLQYAAKINILNESKDTLEEALAAPNIKAYLNDIVDYHSILVSNHKNPDLPIHKLLFLLDNGFDTYVPEIQTAINRIMENKDGMLLRPNYHTCTTALRQIL